MNGWLAFSITICVFGNSFLFGHNIAVINSPSKLIKFFYAQTYLARDGVATRYDAATNALYYLEEPGVASNVTTVAPSVTVVVVATNTSGNNNGTTVATTTMKPRDPLLAKNSDDIDKDNFIEILWSVTVAIFVLFGMIGAFTSGKIADHFGRKKGMIIITVLMFVAAVFGGIPIIAKSPECLIISRAVVGLHNGICVSLASLYLAEISPKNIRGAVGTCHQLFITIGIFWSMVMGLPDLVGTWDMWPVLFAFNAFPALVCLLLMPLCPESPRYLLIKKNDEDAARKALQKLRGTDNVEEDIEEMRAEARKQSTVDTFTLKRLLTTPELKLPIIIAVVMQVAQQWSGINAAMSYSRDIFKQANVPEDSIPYVVVGQGAINVLATIVCVPLMEKLGRRPLLLFPMVAMVLSFLVLTVCLNLLESPDMADHTGMLANICIAAMLCYIIGFAVGLGPIPFIIVSEIFRQEPRAAAMSFSLAFNWICNFILMISFRFIQKSIEAYTYIIFMVILGASIAFIFFFVPETKNRTFDEVARSIGFRKGGKGRQYTDGEELQPMGDQKI